MFILQFALLYLIKPIIYNYMTYSIVLYINWTTSIYRCLPTILFIMYYGRGVGNFVKHF